MAALLTLLFTVTAFGQKPEVKPTHAQLEARANLEVLRQNLVLPVGVQPRAKESTLATAWLKSQGVSEERLAKSDSENPSVVFVSYGLKVDGETVSLTQRVRDVKKDSGDRGNLSGKPSGEETTLFTFKWSSIRHVGLDLGGNKSEVPESDSLAYPVYAFDRSPSLALVFKQAIPYQKSDAAGSKTKGTVKAVLILRSDDSDVERLYAALTLVFRDKNLAVPFARYGDIENWIGF